MIGVTTKMANKIAMDWYKCNLDPLIEDLAKSLKKMKNMYIFGKWYFQLLLTQLLSVGNLETLVEYEHIPK